MLCLQFYLYFFIFSGFITGHADERPLAVSFLPNFDKGALLMVVCDIFITERILFKTLFMRYDVCELCGYVFCVFKSFFFVLLVSKAFCRKIY